MGENKAFAAAYRKGYQAYVEKGAHARCPYFDYRGGRHGQVITFSRAFQKYWWDGYNTAKRESTGETT